MGQVLHSGPVSTHTLTGLTSSTRHPVATTPHLLAPHVHPTRHLEFILPDGLCRSAQARAHLASLFDTELPAGQQARVLHQHHPRAARGAHLLSLRPPQQSSRLADGRHRINHDALVERMTQRGFTVRLLNASEVPCVQRSLRYTLLHRRVTLITLECGPDTTHPDITRALRDALERQPYFYVLDFQRLPDRDTVTNSAQCLYTLNLVMPDATAHAVRRAQDALFEMNGALASRRIHDRGAPLPVTPLTHLGSTYTVADLIPA